MSRLGIWVTATAVCWCLGATYAGAQSYQLGTYGPPQVRSRSPVSPYVTLGQGGNAADYYGVVRPQMDANRSINQLQSGLNQLNADGTPAMLNSGLLNPALQMTGSQTGHPATYMNYQRFFPLSYGTVSGGIVPGVTGMGGYTPGLGAYGAGTGAFGVGAQGVRPFYSGAFNSSIIR